MPRFSEQFIQQVTQATDIVELVSRYVALKRAGKEFVCLCPFHDDHNPSMHVVPAKQMFYCFVCGAGGGVIKFVEMYDKLPFVEAVTALAERAGIPLPTPDNWQPNQGGPTKSDLLKVMAFADRFYRAQLRLPQAKPAMEYATGRGLTEESLEKYGIGHSPAGWDGLIQAARKQRIPEPLLMAAGLAIKREGSNGCYDRFRNRLMFPILDADGRCIAFGGRALDPNEKAKYINSPETALFDKSNNLYALSWSRAGIVASGQMIVVEGYMDAVMPLQAGVTNIVATLGTALNDRHVRLIARYAKEVVLIYDADDAGMMASERALEVFLAQQINVRIATIPSGKDPCDFVLAEGGAALTKLAAEAPDALKYIWERRSAAYKAKTGNLAGGRALVEDFLRLVATSSAYGAIDEVRRGQLAQHIGHMLNIAPQDLGQQMKALARTINRPAPAPVKTVGRAADLNAAEAKILEVLLNRPDLFDNTAEKIDPADFTDPALRQVAECLWQLGARGQATLEDLLASPEGSAVGPLVAELVAAGSRRGNYEEAMASAMEYMLYRRQRERMGEVRQQGFAEGDFSKLHRELAGPNPQVPPKDLRRHPKIN